jgi:integrase
MIRLARLEAPRPKKIRVRSTEALFRRYRRAHSLSEGAIAQYEVVLRLIRRWRGAAISTRKFFREATVSKFLSWLERTPDPRTRKPRSGNTINSKFSHIRSLWQFCQKLEAKEQRRQDRLKGCGTQRIPIVWCIERVEDADVRKPRRMKNPVNIWKKSEVELMIHKVDAGLIWPGWDRRNWLAAIGLLWYSGARPSQLLAAERKDLSADDFLLLRGENAKERRGRIVRLPPSLCTILRSLPHEGNSLLGWNFSDTWLRSCFRSILVAAGLPSAKGDPFKRFRKAVGTELTLKKGLEFASKALGHASVQVTREHYVHESALDTSRAAEHLEELNLE